MQMVLDSRAKKWRGIGVASFVAGLALVASLPLSDAGEPFCPMRRLLGLPCLLCGGTRATQALIYGQWDRAFYLNPWAVIAVILAGLWAIAALLEIGGGKRILPAFQWTVWRWAGFFLILTICWGIHMWSAVTTPKPELLYDRSVAHDFLEWFSGH